MRYGFIALPHASHVRPMMALARCLTSRGHDAVFFGIPDVRGLVGEEAVRFVPFGERAFPEGAFEPRRAGAASRSGMATLDYSVSEIVVPLLRPTFDELPGLLVREGIEAMVVDTAFAFAELVPMSLRIPYVQVWLVLNMDSTGQSPPNVSSAPYEVSASATARNNGVLETLGARFFGPCAGVAAEYAARTGLDVDLTKPGATTSRWAVVSQTPRAFDYPIRPWEGFHHGAPFAGPSAGTASPFPWGELTDRPLVYASLGTVVNGHPKLSEAILRAAGRLPGVQVVLSTGGNIDPGTLRPVASEAGLHDAILVRHAPQVDLLRRAALCVTHAGLNTALECLAAGVPMLAVPIGYDQPGVAARIAYYRVGEFLDFDDVTVEGIAGLMIKIMGDPTYAENARRLAGKLASLGGADMAADIIERAVSARA